MSDRVPHPPLRLNLALIGGRGSGKSSVCKRLARRNRNFSLFSLDALIRYEAGGLPIPELVERHGWRHFRELEFQVLGKLCAFPDSALLDCGGGIVVDLDDAGAEVYSDRKVALLTGAARVVYLQRDSDYLLRRIGEDPERPALSESESFHQIMERRDPWYRRAAHLVIECGDASKTEITDRVLSWFYAECRREDAEALARG